MSQSHVAKKHVALKRAAVLSAAVLVAIVASGVRYEVGYRNRLNAAADKFSSVNHLSPQWKTEGGTVWCFVSCGAGGEAFVRVNYELDAVDEREASRISAEMLAKAFGSPEPLGLGDVLTRTKVGSVAERAYAQIEHICSGRASGGVGCDLVLTIVSGIE